MGVTQEIARNCKEYSVFITIYSCSNFFYGSKLASEDIAKQKEDAVVLKTSSADLGGQKIIFSPEEDVFFPFFPILFRDKWRGVTLDKEQEELYFVVCSGLL